MKILSGETEKRIQDDILGSILRYDYPSALRVASEVLDDLHLSIPDGKRISYGRVYTIKVLSKYLYDRLAGLGAPVYETSVRILEESRDIKCQGVALGMLSLYGLGDCRRVLLHFESAAASDHWDMREFAQMFFRKLIKEHPQETRDYLLRLVKSPDPKVRRFVGETLRPVQENAWFYQDPEYRLSILRYMFREGSAYPRTSAGNNLSDLARRLPDLVSGLVDELVGNGDRNSYWIAYRACRNLVKKEPVRVMDLLRVDEYKYKERVYRRSDYQRD